MKTVNKQSAYRTLVTQHKNLRYVSDLGCVSVRKSEGRFVVSLEDFDTHKTVKSSFATLAGATIQFETLSEFYL